MTKKHIHFVTGRLAEHALRSVLNDLAPRVDFEHTVQVLPITVAALMSTDWIARRIAPPDEATHIFLPGYCQGELQCIAAASGLLVERGPTELRQLPDFFGHGAATNEGYGDHDIEIIAEINHAPKLPLASILKASQQLRADGADVIDIGCIPGQRWSGVGPCVRALCDAGLRVSIDSFDVVEVQQATAAGAELVLSVNSGNRHAAPDWGCEVVAIPDDIATLGGLEATVEWLAARNVPLRIDPILEPIGFGFAASLQRYWQTRLKYPDAEMMMGVGNLTELTDVDSAGVNTLLLAYCQEIGARSVLTTQVIPWAKTSVRECDVARRLAWFSVTNRVPPKRLDARLIMLRDARIYEQGDEQLGRLAEQIKDHNFRIFAENGELHVVGRQFHLAGDDPFPLFEQLLADNATSISPEHAFYLGYELAKAATALTLGKQYRQDEALDWGLLTRAEISHRERKSAARRDRSS